MSGRYTYQLESDEAVQEAGLTDFGDHVEQVKFHSRHLVDVEVAIDPFLLKQKQHEEHMNYFPSGLM